MRDDTDRPRDGKDPSAPRHLRLIHPTPPPKPDTTPRTRSGRRAAYHNDLFTREEEARIRAALRHARTLFGTWACLADAMRVPTESVIAAAGGRTHPPRVTGALAIRLARALGKPVESLCRAPADAATCATCGARRVP